MTNPHRYVLAARLPHEQTWIKGMRSHSTMEDVHRQLRRTAPQWRAVLPGVRFAIREVEDS